MNAAPAFVLDCSVALGAFFADEQDAYSVAVWQSVATAQPCVPPLWHLEMGNILARAQRSGRIDADALHACWTQLERVGVQTLAVTGEARDWLARASEWQLTAYDACYLEAARQHRLPLATKDNILSAAARRAGIPLYLADQP